MANSTDPSFSKEHAVPQVQTKAEQSDPVESSSGPEPLPHREHSMPSISRLLKGKEREWKAVRSKTGPLYLLDLPVDILRLVVKEVSNMIMPCRSAIPEGEEHGLTSARIYRSHTRMTWRRSP